MKPGEAALWRRMSAPDRRHAVGVARRVDVALGPDASRPVLAAALLHDVGKIDSAFGPVRRALATVAGEGWGYHPAQGRRRRLRGSEPALAGGGPQRSVGDGKTPLRPDRGESR